MAGSKNFVQLKNYSSDSKLTFYDSEDDEEELQDYQDLNDLDIVKLDSTNFEDTIKYRAEGNANIVLALLETCQVLRFKKTHLNGAIVIPQTPVGPDPCMVTCPQCQNRVMSRIDYETTTKTHICAGILCLTCLWCFAWIPYCCGSCARATNHYCPNCNAFLGQHNN